MEAPRSNGNYWGYEERGEALDFPETSYAAYMDKWGDRKEVKTSDIANRALQCTNLLEKLSEEPESETELQQVLKMARKSGVYKSREDLPKEDRKTVNFCKAIVERELGLTL